MICEHSGAHSVSWPLYALFSYSRSSFGWDPPEKRKELFDPLSRFILVHLKGDEDGLIAFVMFRFEYEERESVLYWSIPSLSRVLLTSTWA